MSVCRCGRLTSMSVRGMKEKKARHVPGDGAKGQAASPWRPLPPTATSDVHYSVGGELGCNSCRGRHPPTAPTNAHNTGRGRSMCLQWDTPISILVGREQFSESNVTNLEFSILLQSSSSTSSISMWISKREHE